MLNTSRELRLLARDVHRHAAAILANSHHTASMLEAFGVDRTKIRVVHPGVDAERFTPSVDARALREKLVKPGELMLLSVGRLQRRKGHDMVVKALARLRHHTPSMRYVIVGAGEERGRLESLVRDLSLGDRVAFEGLADETMLPAYYAACDIFLMPNRVDGVDFEGFGIVFLEAAASSRPAIGGRSGGVVEAIEEGSSGLLVSGTDEDELAAAIARLASSDALRHEMGRAARGRVLTRFTWARAAADVANLHRLLLAGK
jgi:phosphatidylinositol alpha-1,6-mannosyltransferase